MSFVEEIRNELGQLMMIAQNVSGQIDIANALINDLDTGMLAVRGAGAPPSTDIADAWNLVREAGESLGNVKQMMAEYAGKILDYSSRL